MRRLETALRALRAVQWRGSYLDGTGARMGFAEQDGTRYAACPLCQGVKPGQQSPLDIRQGHAKYCLIRKALENK